MRLLTTLLAVAASALFADSPPAGFTPLFNGKDLAGWHGYNPHSVTKLTGEKKDAMLAKMREEFPQHWGRMCVDWGWLRGRLDGERRRHY